MISNKKKIITLLSAVFTFVFLLICSPSIKIMAEGISYYDNTSYIEYKANVVGKSDYDYINDEHVTIEFNLPASIDHTKLMVQYVISDLEEHVWDVSYDYSNMFNTVGVVSFTDTLPYNENYIHSRIKLYGTDTIYYLSPEYVCIDKDDPESGEIKSDYIWGTWTNQDVTVKIRDAIDATSGIMSQTYRILKDDSIYTDWKTYSNALGEFSVTLTETGVYTIYVASMDYAFNEGEEYSRTVKIDKEIPIIGELISSSPTYWSGSDVTISINKEIENDIDYEDPTTGDWISNYDSFTEVDTTFDLSVYNANITAVDYKNIMTNLQVGINSDSSNQISFDTNFELNLGSRGDLTSDEALASIMNFQAILSDKATALGAVENRLQSAIESIEVNIENLTSSLSTIRDADIAEVSSEYIRQQILQQASATLLSTANQSPSIALQLI